MSQRNPDLSEAVKRGAEQGLTAGAILDQLTNTNKEKARLRKEGPSVSYNLFNALGNMGEPGVVAQMGIAYYQHRRAKKLEGGMSWEEAKAEFLARRKANRSGI